MARKMIALLTGSDDKKYISEFAEHTAEKGFDLLFLTVDSEPDNLSILRYADAVLFVPTDLLTEKFIGRYSSGLIMEIAPENITDILAEIPGLLNNSSTSNSRQIPSLDTSEREELAAVENILNENLFTYHFQPIVSAVDGEIYSYEALMRSASDSSLSPLKILKHAETLGRLKDIEIATFMNVLPLLDENRDTLKNRLVFINSIPGVRPAKSDLDRIGLLLAAHCEQAVVEMTEQTEPDEEALETIKKHLGELGVKIAIDDYGTGYSNVRNLLRYTPNYVKIDRSLLSDIQESPKKRHFVREIVDFCHANGIMALAEGVETSEELRTVIRIGVDLIQGFYTARPAADIIEAIDIDIRREICRYHKERIDGRISHTYKADTPRVQLEKLAGNDYRCVYIGQDSGDVTVAGSPSLETEIHIDIGANYSGTVTLENVCLSNIKNRPCIEISENSDVTLILRGESSLKKGGIRVPESSALTLSGDGDLNIKVDSTEYYAIGNDLSSRHGRLVFQQDGAVIVDAVGKQGVCIGSGLGGEIHINKGKYVLTVNGDIGVGVGAITGAVSLDIHDCDFTAEVGLSRSVGIGSLNNNADIHIHRALVKCYVGGNTSAALGSLDGESTDILINDANVIVDIRSENSTAAGSLSGFTSFTVDKAGFRFIGNGDNALAFGGTNENTHASFIGSDITVKLQNKLGRDTFAPEENISIDGGRCRFIVNEAELNRT